MKKLKKKQRPMTFAEWKKTSGSDVAALSAVNAEYGEDVAALEALVERGQQIIAENEDFMAIGLKIELGYHAYICAFIANLLERQK